MKSALPGDQVMAQMKWRGKDRKRQMEWMASGHAFICTVTAEEDFTNGLDLDGLSKMNLGQNVSFL